MAAGVATSLPLPFPFPSLPFPFPFLVRASLTALWRPCLAASCPCSATALILAANRLLSLGQSEYVHEYLWTSDPSALRGGAIKYDLDYIVASYGSQTCDLWEELRDADFFWNRVTMKKAMILGAAFASAMGDAAASAAYSDTIAALNATLYADHYYGAYVQESGGRPRDSAVIVGFNAGYDGLDQLFAPTSLEVAQTVGSYNLLFCGEYAVNRADSLAGLPGVLYGRYAKDTYAGEHPPPQDMQG
jgi:glucoamylase